MTPKPPKLDNPINFYEKRYNLKIQMAAILENSRHLEISSGEDCFLVKWPMETAHDNFHACITNWTIISLIHSTTSASSRSASVSGRIKACASSWGPNFSKSCSTSSMDSMQLQIGRKPVWHFHSYKILHMFQNVEVSYDTAGKVSVTFYSPKNNHVPFSHILRKFQAVNRLRQFQVT